MTNLPAHNYHKLEDWMTAGHTSWLAVVGARSFVNPNGLVVARQLVEDTIEHIQALEDVADRNFGIVSGGADGVDSIGEEVADDCWYRKVIFPPRNRVWEPDGFKARNELVGQLCSFMVAVRCFRTKTWGTGHAAEYTESLGKPVARYVVCANLNCTGHSTDSSWRINDGCSST